MLLTSFKNMIVVASGLLLCHHVGAYDDDKLLLESNALAYIDNFEVDKEIKGNCLNGPPPGGTSAPDAQTTKDDKPCQELVSRESELDLQSSDDRHWFLDRLRVVIARTRSIPCCSLIVTSLIH